MRTKKSFFLASILVAFFAIYTHAQNEHLNFSIPQSENEEDFTVFNMNDFRDALVQLGINVYKWNMDIPKDKDYRVEVYLQEYEHDKMIKDSIIDRGSSVSWGFNDKHLAEYKYLSNLRIITEKPVYPNKVDEIKLRIKKYPSNFQVTKIINPRPEYHTYFIRQFEDTKLEISKNIPLLLITAGWETNAGGKTCRKFCGPNRPPVDLDDYSLYNSDHYFVIGYRILDEDFYGRDLN